VSKIAVRAVIAAAVAAGFTLGGAQATHTGKRIVLAINQDEGELSPFTYVTGYPGYNLMSLVYDTLMQTDLNGVPRPWLAETATSSNGGKVWTFKLQAAAKWHDGRALTSADVKFSYEYYKKYPVVGRFASAVGPIASIATPDARTVVMTLPKAEANFALQALSDVPIIPKHLWESVTTPKDFKNTVGSGPFKFVEHRADSYRLVENPDYFAGKPAADEVVLPIIPDPTTAFQALQAGQVNATTREVQPELIARFSSDSRLKVVRGPGFTSTLLQFNTATAPFNNVGLRRVVAGVINYKGLVDTILLGNGTPGRPGFVHPESPFFSASAGEYQRLTAAQANQQLDSLGFKRGSDGVRVGRDGKKLEVPFLVQSNNPLRIRAAEIIAADLKPLGINLNVRSLDPTTVQQALWPDFDVAKGRNFQIAMWGWSAPVQSQLNLRGLFHSTPATGTLNVGGFKNATINVLTDRMATTVDAEARRGLAAQVQAIVAKELPFVTLWYPDGVYAYNASAFDGWKYQKGQGIINKHSFVTR
jgi:peptide/nickel transport system substrate-binding protein